MKPIYKILFSIYVLFYLTGGGTTAQTLVASYPLPNNSSLNNLWGLTQVNDTLWLGSDLNGKLFKITKSGIVKDSLATPFDFNHGLAWDGTGFWVARDYVNSSVKLLKVNLLGALVDSIAVPNVIGGRPDYIGGIGYDGSGIWFTVYYPDYPSYPYTYAYRISLSTRLITDTIPLRGKQPQGITVKGDTILYVNDFFNDGTFERIYAYRKAVGDTLFSFPGPDPDGDCNPRGLFWDGQYLWLNAERIGGVANAYRVLYKYSLTGAGSPQITTTTNLINFGNVIIGQTANQPLGITNTGTATLIISAFTMTNPRFTILPNTVPDTITQGNSKNYTVSFTPNAFDTTSGELRIASNDAATPLKVVNLKGKGVYNGSYISLSSTNYDWTARRINSLCGWQFNITNLGSQPLVISSITFSTQRFKFDNTGITFPVTIDTQKTKQFRIWFNPNAVSSFSDSAVITSNAVNSPQVKIYLSGSGVDNPTALGDVMWQGTIPDNPLTSYQDYQPTSIKQIGDVNGDGVNDIIVTTENYQTICFNGNSSVTSDILWIFNTYFGSINTGSVDWEDAMQIRDDVNGDGIPDVVIGCGGGNEEVYTLSGKTGAIIWQYGDSIATADGDIMSVRADKDYNGDGVKDVLVSASGTGQGGGRHAAICINGLTGQQLFISTQSGDFTYDAVSTETGGAIGYGTNGGTYGVSGFNNLGSIMWNYPVTGAVWNMKEIPDINGNGSKDIIGMFGFSGAIFAINGNNGNQIWTNSLGNSNNGTIVLLDDLDKNGFKDFTLSGPTSVYRIDSKTDSIQWTASPSSSYIRNVDDIGDINGDTIHEIVAGMQQPGKVMVLDGKNGSTLFEYSFGSSLSYRADRVAKLNSIDGNGSAEFIGACRDGRIKCFSGGPLNPIGIKPISNTIPKEFRLYQNYPNPFNPETKIKFDIPSFTKGGFVKLVIYDVLGREIAVIVNEKLVPGTYTGTWSADKLSSGVYFYKLTAGDFSDVKKLVLLK